MLTRRHGLPIRTDPSFQPALEACNASCLARAFSTHIPIAITHSSSLRTAVICKFFFVSHDGMGCAIRTDPSFQTALFKPKKHLANRSLAPFQHTSPFISRTAPDFSVRSAQGSGFHSREFMGCAIRSGPLAYHLGHEHMLNMCSWLTGWQMET